MKHFATEIGAPEAIICDAGREQISKDDKNFCNKMGTTLRVLEEGTLNVNPPWDTIINQEKRLQHEDKLQCGKVIQRSVGPDGKTARRYDNKPCLNSMIYDVGFLDGQVKEYAAYILVEIVLIQVNSEGFRHALYDAIVDYKKDISAVDKTDRFIMTRRGRKRLKQTTKGRQLLVAWKDGSETWILVKKLK